MKVKKPAPLITGIAIKNENFAASFALIPIKRAQEIVIPLREIPGAIARAWKNPINIDEIILCSLFLGLKKQDESKMKPVNNNALLTMK